MKLEELEAVSKEHAATKASVVAAFDNMQFTVPYLGHEISIGKASGKDVRHLLYRTRALGFKLGTLLLFHKFSRPR